MHGLSYLNNLPMISHAELKLLFFILFILYTLISTLRQLNPSRKDCYGIVYRFFDKEKEDNITHKNRKGNNID